MTTAKITITSIPTTADGSCFFHAILGKKNNSFFNHVLFNQHVNILRKDIQTVLNQYASDQDLPGWLRSILFGGGSNVICYKFTPAELAVCGVPPGRDC